MNSEGWTQTPNIILDNMARMKPAVFKVCMVVVRQTCGYIDKQGNRKEWDRLSTSRIMELSGLSNRTVIDAVEEAIKENWIERRPAGQYFEYRVAPMKIVHSELMDNEKTYEDISQVTYEESSQVEPTYEKTSQEPMKKLHTQKKRKKKNNNTSSAPTNDEWFDAMCWLVFGHQDHKLLSAEDRINVGKTIKVIRDSENNYTINDLRAWYRDKWSNEWPGKQQGKSDIQRPTLKQIKAGIGQVKAGAFDNQSKVNKSIQVVKELEK